MSQSEIIVVSGPSGVGKDTIIGHLTNEYGFRKAISFTTRPKRVGELDGKDYHYVSKEKFAQMNAAGELLDHAVVTGNHYGLSRTALAWQLRSNGTLVINAVVETGRIVRSSFDRVSLVFIRAPSMEQIIQRLRQRGMRQEEIDARYREAPMQHIPPDDYDQVVCNYDGESRLAAMEIMQAITSRQQLSKAL